MSNVEWLRTSGGLQHEFIKSEAFAAGFGDSSTGSFGEAEGSHVDLWHVENALIVGDGSNADNGSVGLAAKVLDDLGERQWWAVGAGGEQSSQHSLGEGGISPAGEESEQLQQGLALRKDDLPSRAGAGKDSCCWSFSCSYSSICLCWLSRYPTHSARSATHSLRQHLQSPEASARVCTYHSTLCLCLY